MTSLLTTALEEMRREVDVFKTDNTQLRTNNDAMKNEMVYLKSNNEKQKDENKQLTTLLDKMAVNNQNQMQQINSQSREIVQLKAQLKTENDDLRRHTGTSKLQPLPSARQQPKVSQWSGIT